MQAALRPHDAFFWTAVFFLLGVLLGSATADFSYPLFWGLGVTLAVASLLWLRERRLAFLCLFLGLGAFYFYLTQSWRETSLLPFDRPATFAALVQESQITGADQKLFLKTEGGQEITVSAFRHPRYRYGDRVMATGVVKKPRSPLTDGFMTRPELRLIAQGQGWWIKRQLFSLREKFQDNLKAVLPYTHAVFLSGLTVGGRSELSSAWQEKFRRSGVMHVVVLSGYNIMVVVRYVGGAWLALVGRRRGLYLTALTVLLFVIMAGAEASLVRAALMGGLLLVAQGAGRLFYVRNAVTAAALVMTVVNPAALAFDVSFQLSFAALLGIVYLEPFINRWFTKKFWGKDQVVTTLAAETAVLPLLLFTFGNVTLWGLVVNPLIAYLIPLTMGLGFVAGALGFLWLPFSLPAAGAAYLLLNYELAVINFFARPF